LFRYALDDGVHRRESGRTHHAPGVWRSRDRVLSDDEIRQLWETFDGLDAPEMGAYYKLRLVTAQRGKELSLHALADRRPRRRLVDHSGRREQETSWRIACRYRLRRSPSWTALDPGDDDRPDRYVLDGARGKRQQIRSGGRRSRCKDFRGHDLRRTAASLMTGGGVLAARRSRRS
jgi:hypothetical protein